MFVWIAILAWVSLKEKFTRWQIFGLVIMVAGLTVMIKFAPTFGRGEMMVFGATLLWALETVFVKQFLKNIDYRFLGASRMALGSVFIFGFAGLTGKFALIAKISPGNWLAIAVVGLFLTGYVYFWYRSLVLISATVTSSILTLAFPITLLISDFRYFKTLTNPEIIGAALIGLAVYFIIKSSVSISLWPATVKN